MGKIVDRQEASQIFDVTTATLDNWRKQGLKPNTAGRGKITFDTADIVQWLINRERGGLDLTKEKAKLTQAQTRKTELEIKRLEGELVPVEEITAEYSVMAGAIKSRMLSMPAKITAAILAAGDTSEIEDVLESEISEVLEELAQDEFSDEVERILTEYFTAIEAAAEIEGEPMGGRTSTSKPGKRKRSRTLAH